ncbi:MAG: hypothetical protein K2Q33_07330 [Gammaproteobacteria bacterium]|nr:hypothetical protein [Gammaproteobacteria bacterium]
MPDAEAGTLITREHSAKQGDAISATQQTHQFLRFKYDDEVFTVISVSDIEAQVH